MRGTLRLLFLSAFSPLTSTRTVPARRRCSAVLRVYVVPLTASNYFFAHPSPPNPQCSFKLQLSRDKADTDVRH